MSISEALKRYIRFLQRTFKGKVGRLRSHITQSRGKLLLDNAPCTFVVVVGPLFDQRKPDAMMTCRIGYCNAFEELGIPYYIVDMNDLIQVLPTLKNPFCMIFGADYIFVDARIVNFLKPYRKFVWVDPWFNESNKFFRSHGLDPNVWTWTNRHRRRIIDSQPSFVYTATVNAGLCFFEEWGKNGCPVLSLPLACDTKLYNHSVPYMQEFEGIRMAFVGGYWKSKGKQIDRYLRPFEDDLVIFGYNEWPYRGYRGYLPREKEGPLYRQALIAPAINEPSVRLLHGQINERVFKVFGCGGLAVVDAVPAYRELFSEEELLIPRDEHQFYDTVRELLADGSLREEFRRRGYQAVVSRHTYMHRAKTILKQLGLDVRHQKNLFSDCGTSKRNNQ